MFLSTKKLHGELSTGSGDRGKTKCSRRWEGSMNSPKAKFTLPLSHDQALLIFIALASLQQVKHSSYFNHFLEILFMLREYKSM